MKMNMLNFIVVWIDYKEKEINEINYYLVFG